MIYTEFMQGLFHPMVIWRVNFSVSLPFGIFLYILEFYSLVQFGILRSLSFWFLGAIILVKASTDEQYPCPFKKSNYSKY